MKKIPKKKRKVTELYFNEYDGIAEIYTYNTKLKKRLTAYAATYPDLCQLIEDDENGGLRFEIDKHRISIRLTAPYSEERKESARQQARQSKTQKGDDGNPVIALFLGMGGMSTAAGLFLIDHIQTSLATYNFAVWGALLN